MDFHHGRYVYRERALLVGTGGGKTVGAMFEVLDWALENPPGTAILAAPTVPMIKKILYKAFEIVTGAPLTEDHYLVAQWNQSDRRLVLKNGWTFWFVSTQDPLSIEGPPECEVVLLTEARVVRRLAGKDGAWSQLTRRLRGRPAHRMAILETHSPTAQIMDLFKTERVEEYRANGGRWEKHICRDPKRAYWQWGLKDALAWGTIGKTDAEATMGDYEGQDAEAVLEGKYARKAGAIYKALNRARHQRPAPPRNRIEWMSYGVDPGWRHLAFMTAHAWQGGSVTTVEEFHGSELDREALIAAAKAMEAKWGSGTWWFGPDNRSPELIKKFREAGLDARQYAGKGVVDGIRELATRLNRGTWAIAPECELLWTQLLDYEWDEEAANKGHEEPVKEADDGPDSARYGIIGGERGESGGLW